MEPGRRVAAQQPMTSSMWLSAVLTFVGLATAVGLVHAPAGGTWRAQPRSSATSLLRSSRIATMQETGALLHKCSP